LLLYNRLKTGSISREIAKKYKTCPEQFGRLTVTPVEEACPGIIEWWKGKFITDFNMLQWKFLYVAMLGLLYPLSLFLCNPSVAGQVPPAGG